MKLSAGLGIFSFLAFSQLFAKSPFEVIAVLEHEEALDRPHDIEVQDNLAYVPGKGGSVAIVDISDLSQPRLKWWQRNTRRHDDAQTVLPAGDFLFLGSRNFHSLDLTDPAQPKFSATLEDDRIDRINGMVRRGDFVFTAQKNGYVGVFDVKNPAQPRAAGFLPTRQQGGLLSPHDIALLDDQKRAIVVDQRRGSPIKACIYRIPADPAQIEQWQVEGQVIGENLNGANRVDVLGRYAVLACSPGITIGVIDLSDPTKPRTVEVLPFAGVHPTGLTIAGSLAFVAGGQTLQVLDLTDPEQPETRAVYDLNPIFHTGEDNAHDLVYRDGYLFLTAQNDHRIAILQLIDPKLRALAENP